MKKRKNKDMTKKREGMRGSNSRERNAEESAEQEDKKEDEDKEEEQ